VCVFVTLWFADALLCAVERRRGVLLGKQRRWPSDACCFVFEGRCCVIWGVVVWGSETCYCG
jgi:hypothetical protein